jgi:hypothetical protein
MKTMTDWYFLREGFYSFDIKPETEPGLLFGQRERRERDHLRDEIEGSCYARAGYKAAVFGDYGRGKTHLCLNLRFVVQQDDLPVIPIYVKCSAFTAKEPFSTLFGQFIQQMNVADLRRVTTAYLEKVAEGKAVPLRSIIHSEDVAVAIESGLPLPNEDIVRNTMRWLSGEKVELIVLSGKIKDRITDSREFGAVMRGISHMYREVDGKVPLFLLDEAERLENITQNDAFYMWLAAMRELTEIPSMGLMLFIGAKTRNQLPNILLSEEVSRRIGTSNYVDFQNPGREDLRGFLTEMLSTLVKKGPVPDLHKPALSSAALTEEIPAELIEITGGDAERLRCFPFEPDAFEEFVEQLASADLSSKPSEAIDRLNKAAQRAMRKDQRTIDLEIVEAIGQEGF